MLFSLFSVDGGVCGDLAPEQRICQGLLMKADRNLCPIVDVNRGPFPVSHLTAVEDTQVCARKEFQKQSA